jgi:hypothetical protein
MILKYCDEKEISFLYSEDFQFNSIYFISVDPKWLNLARDVEQVK